VRATAALVEHLTCSHAPVTLGVCPPLKAFPILEHTGYVRELRCQISLLLFLRCGVRTGGFDQRLPARRAEAHQGGTRLAVRDWGDIGGTGELAGRQPRRVGARTPLPLFPTDNSPTAPCYCFTLLPPGMLVPVEVWSLQRKRREVRSWRPTPS
jgi:hypothetical protein